MKLGSVAGGLLTGRARSRGRRAAGLTIAMTGFRMLRRMTKHSTKPVIRFAVKPGEVYEIRGIRRDR
jgi:hypothetical protein